MRQPNHYEKHRRPRRADRGAGGNRLPPREAQAQSAEHGDRRSFQNEFAGDAVADKKSPP